MIARYTAALADALTTRGECCVPIGWLSESVARTRIYNAGRVAGLRVTTSIDRVEGVVTGHVIHDPERLRS